MGMLGFCFCFPAASGLCSFNGTTVADEFVFPDCVTVASRWLVCVGDWSVGRVMVVRLVFVRWRCDSFTVVKRLMIYVC